MKKLVFLIAALLVVGLSASEGESIYNKSCKLCHGAKAERKALNKSQVIQKWPKENLITALKGYRDGTYGGNMKSIMKPKVKDLSDEQIEKIAQYITTLK